MATKAQRVAAFEAHRKAIIAGEVTKSNVIGLRKALNADARRLNGWYTGRTSPHLTEEQGTWLWDHLGGDYKPRVVGALHDSGKALLQSKRYRKQLASVAEIVADIAEFRLVGFEALGNRGEYFVPVYRAYDTKGRSFPFMVVPWQSGGNGPQIMSANYY